MLRTSSRKNATGSMVDVRQSLVNDEMFSEAKEGYLEDVTKFANRQEEGNKEEEEYDGK
jgi:hypothetical protein